jgi:hypothetical protein
MPLIKVYNIDSDLYGLKGHSIFKSVRPFIFGYVAIPKLHEWYLRRHARAASAEAVSFCRTFGDEAWSQQKHTFFFDLHFSLYLAHKNLINCVGHLITKTLLKLPKGTFPFHKGTEFGRKFYIDVWLGGEKKVSDEAARENEGKVSF